jgi:hypothetical protein
MEGGRLTATQVVAQQKAMGVQWGPTFGGITQEQWDAIEPCEHTAGWLADQQAEMDRVIEGVQGPMRDRLAKG